MRSHETLWVQSPTFTFPAPHRAPAWLVQVAVSALCCPCPLLPDTLPLVTVKVVRRCCQPWSRTLDNKAKVINWWWLDSNSQVRLDMSHVMPDITNICWYSDIMWHDPTFTWRLHQPPMRFMNRNRPIEPIHKSPSLCRVRHSPTVIMSIVETYAAESLC